MRVFNHREREGGRAWLGRFWFRVEGFLILGAVAEGEVVVAVVEVADEVGGGEEDDPLAVLVSGDDAAGGEFDLRGLAIAS